MSFSAVKNKYWLLTGSIVIPTALLSFLVYRYVHKSNKLIGHEDDGDKSEDVSFLKSDSFFEKGVNSWHQSHSPFLALMH